MRPCQDLVRKNKPMRANPCLLKPTLRRPVEENDPGRRAGELDREKSQLIEENTRLQRAAAIVAGHLAGWAFCIRGAAWNTSSTSGLCRNPADAGRSSLAPKGNGEEATPPPSNALKSVQRPSRRSGQSWPSSFVYWRNIAITLIDPHRPISQ
jgi:hypothetical protein